MGARVLLAVVFMCTVVLGQATVPDVVRTVPAALAEDVDPALAAITATFSEPMTDGSWSWTGGGDSFPQMNGKPSYDAARTTCTMPVKLEPGKVYWVGINSPSHRNFKSEKGQPARRYVILFATRSENGEATPIAPELVEEAQRINLRGARTTPAKAVDSSAAERAAGEWMELVDAGDYAEGWAKMDEFAKQMADEQAFTGQLKAVRGSMGKLVDRKLSDAQHSNSLPGTPDGSYFLLKYDSSFEKKKQAVETVVMSQREGAWRVSGYFIR